ncbi:MAG: arginyltransferase [Planctomycetes bacterium]|nr:arginyltransferase [Planctomycetota bacterium]
MLVHFDGLVPGGRCPYLPGRDWRRHLLVVLGMTPGEYLALLDQGYRRMGRYVYRPRCAGCSECRPLRIPIAGFLPSRTQRRIRRANADLEVTVGEPVADAERVKLHNRHGGERLNNPSIDLADYAEIFADSPVPTVEVAYRLGGRLVALAILDRLGAAHSAVYTFFDPDLSARSLGTYSVLWQIEHARAAGAAWLHLGFHVAGSTTMVYKANFRPCEKLDVDGVWKPFRGAPSSARPGAGA